LPMTISYFVLLDFYVDNESRASVIWIRNSLIRENKWYLVNRIKKNLFSNNNRLTHTINARLTAASRCIYILSLKKNTKKIRENVFLIIASFGDWTLKWWRNLITPVVR
jgi:hypothetical protein